MKQNRVMVGLTRFLLWLAGIFAFCAVMVIVMQQYKQWLFLSSTFRIRRIEVEGNDLVSEKEILNLGTVPGGKNIWKVNLSESEKRIKTNPFIENAVVARYFPDVVFIRIEEKKPIALLNAEGTFYSIDQNGILFPAKPGKLYDLPVVSFRGDEPVRTGQAIKDESVLKCLDFIRMILQGHTELYAEVSELVFAKSEGLTLYTRRQGVPVRMGVNGYETKIRILEAFLSEWSRNPNESKIDYVDLRFEGQVVVGMGA